MKKVIVWTKSPKEIYRILKGEQTIMLSKILPKCELPIDVYLRCSKKTSQLIVIKDGDEVYGTSVKLDKPVLIKYPTYFEHVRGGKIICKFTLIKVDEISSCGSTVRTGLFIHEFLSKCCLSNNKLDEYRKDKCCFALHISNLVIFDKPMELGEFVTYCNEYWGNENPNCEKCIHYADSVNLEHCKCNGMKPITKAPQLFMYAYIKK